MDLLLTGATGSVGVELVAQLLAHPHLRALRCLVRGPDAPGRLRGALTRAGYGACALDPRLVVLPGDLLAPNLGLSLQARLRLRSTLTHVLHGAGSIRFDLAEADIFPVNVEGTRRIIAFALDTGRPIRFGYLSTLFVVGRRVGSIPENATPTEQGFLNAYEASKWQAEKLVRSADLDASIYRLPLLLGRARDGYVHHYVDAHMLLEAFARGSLPEFPGAATNTLPLMPTDVAAREVLTLLLERCTPEATHALAPGEALIAFADLFELVRTSLREVGTTAPPTPRFVGVPPSGAFPDMLQHLLLSRRFEAGRHRRRLGPAPSPQAWIPGVLRHCIAAQWGRAS